MNCLVTGANGFIGSHLVRALLARGDSVRVLVRSTSDLSALDGLPVQAYIGDLRDPVSLDAPCNGVHVVFHLGAALLVTSRDAFQAVNHRGTVNLLDAVERNAGDQRVRFLLVSSQAAAGPSSDETPLTEADPPRPISWYGESKLDAEKATLARADRLDVTILRPSSVYGERERDISQTFGTVASGLRVTPSLRTSHLVAIYVGDLVDAILAAADSPKTRGEVYFANHPQALTTGGFVQIIARALGRPGVPVRIPSFVLKLIAPVAEFAHHLTRARPALTRDKAREVGQRYWLADSSKLTRDTGWRASHDHLAGMRKAVASWREQKARVREMPLERSRLLLWLKYLSVAVTLGVMIEITSYLAAFYRFEPAWGVFLIVFGAFGAGLGGCAMLLRRRSALFQLLVGAALATGAELLNAFDLLPGLRWVFAPGWPLGIDDPVLRSVVLGLAGGIFVTIVNALMRALYQHRERVG